MIIIIEKADLNQFGKDFPFELIEYGKFHSKIIATQIKDEVNEDESFVLTKSIYAEAGNRYNKTQLLELIGKAL